MGNALYTNWDDAQKTLYSLQSYSSNAFGYAVGIVLTHCCVAAWIWNSKMKDKDTSPSFVVSMLMLWTVWSLLFNNMIAPSLGGGTRVYQIALPILALGGFLANLLLSSLWHFLWSQERPDENEDTRSVLTSPLLEDDRTHAYDTMLDVEEAPIQPTPPPPPKREPVDYINNIKIFLTVVVILHHCASPFSWWPGLMFMSSNPTSWGAVILTIFVGTNAS